MNKNRQLAELFGWTVEKVDDGWYKITSPGGWEQSIFSDGWTIPCTDEDDAWGYVVRGYDFLHDANTCLWSWERTSYLLYLSGKFDDWGMRIERRSWLGKTRWEAIIWAWSMPPYCGKKTEKLIAAECSNTELEARINCMIAVLAELQRMAAAR